MFFIYRINCTDLKKKHESNKTNPSFIIYIYSKISFFMSCKRSRCERTMDTRCERSSWTLHTTWMLKINRTIINTPFYKYTGKPISTICRHYSRVVKWLSSLERYLWFSCFNCCDCCLISKWLNTFRWGSFNAQKKFTGWWQWKLNRRNTKINGMAKLLQRGINYVTDSFGVLEFAHCRCTLWFAFGGGKAYKESVRSVNEAVMSEWPRPPLSHALRLKATVTHKRWPTLPGVAVRIQMTTHRLWRKPKRETENLSNAYVLMQYSLLFYL